MSIPDPKPEDEKVGPPDKFEWNEGDLVVVYDPSDDPEAATPLPPLPPDEKK